MTTDQRVTNENPPPRMWRIPIEIRRRLSGRVGRQRAIAFEEHLLIVLHPVPNRAAPRQPGVYFWRSPEGEWCYSEQGAGFTSLEELVQQYEDTVLSLEHSLESATTTKEYFEILDQIGPIHRAARNLHETLGHAREQTIAYEQRAQLQPLCDQASEIEHSAETLQVDVQNAIQYETARQTELQAGFSRAQSRAAHRLNILAAIFLPLATLSSAFGMNLTSGIENLTPALFWLVMLLGVTVGAVIGVFVMNVRGLKPDEW